MYIIYSVLNVYHIN